jgi:hypothetical protein
MVGRWARMAIVTAGLTAPVMGPGVSAAAGGDRGLRAERLVLDSYERRADGAAGPVSTRRPLTRGRQYVITVRGTLSFYPAGLWLTPEPPRRICGRPEPRPLFAGVAQPVGPVGFDAETIFALPTTTAHCHRLRLPRRWGNFQIAVGTRFAHRRPLPARSRPAKLSHTYQYRVRGRGRRARFRLVDSHATDNYGQLHIAVRRLSRPR